MFNIEDVITSNTKEYFPGCGISLTEKAIPVYEKTVGYADLENHIPISQQTNFRLASVTKQFIAVCILILIEKNQITTEDALFKFFPDFPTYSKNITIHHLLTHSSGIFDYENLIPESQTKQVHDEDVFNMLKEQTNTMFPPGTKYSYSNGGYCLLRLIIEKISGQTIDTFLTENIFGPLEMKSTVVNYQGVTSIPNRAYGYSFQGSEWIKTDQDKTSATIGDGGIYSSIADMQKWSQVFYTDKILSKTMRDLMLSRHIRTDEGKEIYYGYGVFLKDFAGKKIAYHVGTSIGFSTGTYYVLDENKVLLFLSNRIGENSLSIMEMIMDKTPLL